MDEQAFEYKRGDFDPIASAVGREAGISHVAGVDPKPGPTPTAEGLLAGVDTVPRPTAEGYVAGHTDQSTEYTINSIDRTRLEGRLLFAAISKIATESQKDKTPDEVLAQLIKLSAEIEGEV